MHPAEPLRISLALLPTPLAEMNNLARHLDIDRILLKRDDLTGLETTGNKIRKLNMSSPTRSIRAFTRWSPTAAFNRITAAPPPILLASACGCD
jgi:hypothetical protein